MTTHQHLQRLARRKRRHDQANGYAPSDKALAEERRAQEEDTDTLEAMNHALTEHPCFHGSQLETIE